MKDADIRQELRKTEILDICLSDNATRVIDELGLLQGKFRVDMALVNNSLHGYEIKSELDNLDRLPGQQKTYNKIFDRITLVADEKHVEEAFKLLPPWWGLISASLRSGRVRLEKIWPARQNFQVEADSLVQLLWREEALSVLRKFKLAKGLSSAPRKQLWKRLSSELSLDDLKACVRQALLSRQDWR